jgi:hypothetical protein
MLTSSTMWEKKASTSGIGARPHFERFDARAGGSYRPVLTYRCGVVSTLHRDGGGGARRDPRAGADVMGDRVDDAARLPGRCRRAPCVPRARGTDGFSRGWRSNR